MTMLLGFLTSDFAVIAADTRACQAGPDGLLFIDDSTPKVFKSAIGLVAGAGWFDLVHDVIGDLKTPASDSNELAGRLRKARDAKGLPTDNPLVALTSWLITYTAGAGPDRRVGLAYCSPIKDYAPVPVQSPGYYLVAPAGMSDAAESQLRQSLERHVTPPSVGLPPGEIRYYYVQLIEQAVKVAARLTDSVSARFQIGLHDCTALGVSPLLDDLHQGVDWD